MGRKMDHCPIVRGVAIAALTAQPSLLACAASHNIKDIPVVDFYGDSFRDLDASVLPIRTCADRTSMLQTPFAHPRLHIEPYVKKKENKASREAGDSTAVALSLGYVSPSREFCALPKLGTVPFFCRDCSTNTCKLTTKQIHGIHGASDFIADLPSYGGCVYIDKFPDGASQARIPWETHWDPLVFVQILAGFLMVSYCQVIAENPIVHAAIGIGSFLTIVVLAFFWWMSRQLKGTLNNLSIVPFGGLASAVIAAMVAFVPAVRQIAISWMMPSHVDDFFRLLNITDPFWGMPVGWIVADRKSVV